MANNIFKHTITLTPEGWKSESANTGATDPPGYIELHKPTQGPGPFAMHFYATETQVITNTTNKAKYEIRQNIRREVNKLKALLDAGS